MTADFDKLGENIDFRSETGKISENRKNLKLGFSPEMVLVTKNESQNPSSMVFQLLNQFKPLNTATVTPLIESTFF